MNASERDRDRKGLKDLAKLAGSAPRPRSPAAADSSGFVDLAALNETDPNWIEAAVLRAKAAHAKSDSFVTVGGVSSEPNPLDMEDDLALPIARGAAWRWPVVGSVLVAAGAIGITALIRAHHPASIEAKPRPIASAETAAALAPPPATEQRPVPDDIPPPPAPAEGATPEGQRASGSEAPTASAPAPKSERHAHASRAASARARRDAKPSAVMPASTPAPVAATPLGAAIKDASGSSLPDRPAAPAVRSALSNALPAARGCLGRGTEAARAVVTFASSGVVSSVQVTGPSSTCIQAALGRAKVPPFARPTYSAAMTVRPPD